MLDAAEIGRVTDAVADVDGGAFPGEVAANLRYRLPAVGTFKLHLPDSSHERAGRLPEFSDHWPLTLLASGLLSANDRIEKLDDELLLFAGQQLHLLDASFQLRDRSGLGGHGMRLTAQQLSDGHV